MNVQEGTSVQDIKPGLNLDIVVNPDWTEEILDLRKATVFDTIDNRIILSQTSPPLTRSYLEKRVKLTYVAQSNSQPARYGVPARVSTLLKEYNLFGSQVVPAVIFTREGEMEQYNVRMYYRVQPTQKDNIILFMDKENIPVIDISLGGAKFTHSKKHALQHGTLINLVLQLDDSKYKIRAKVIRIISLKGRMEKDLETVGVQFVNLDRDTSEHLSKKIRAIEREQRYKEKFLDKT